MCHRADSQGPWLRTERGYFPEAAEFASLREVKIKECDLKRMISSISYAVGADDSRKAITGILQDNPREVWVSLKITGPAYVKGSTKPDGVWLERIIVINDKP